MNSVVQGANGGAPPRSESLAIMGSRHKAGNDGQIWQGEGQLNIDPA
jgi:hypothetical protein